MKLRFTFHEDDHETYGAGTWTFDPAALVRQPWRDLAEIEAAIGMSIPAIVLRLDRTSAPGYTAALIAATWVARRLAGVDEPFETYGPMVYQMVGERISDEADDHPPAGASSSSPENAEA